MNKQEKLNEVFDTVNNIDSNELLSQVLSSAIPNTLHNLRKNDIGLTEDDLLDITTLLLSVITEAFNKGGVAQKIFSRNKTASLPMLDEMLTEEEVDTLLAFYKTPASKKLLKVIPKMTSISANIGQEVFAEFVNPMVDHELEKFLKGLPSMNLH